MKKLYQTSSVHTHTTYCDGKNTPTEMVQGALEQGLKTLGFSGHIYISEDTCSSMSPENTKQYCAEVEALKQKYAGRLEILRGTEYDPLSGWSLPQNYDYVIGSVHAIQGKEDGVLYPVDFSTEQMQECIAKGFGGNSLAAVQEYYEQLVKVAQLKPTILGHFDLIIKTNQNNVLFDEKDKAYLNLALEALDACMEQGVCFEMNTGAIWRGWRKEAYPDDVLLKRLAEKKANITITADAHEVQALTFGYDRCAKRAKAAGVQQLLVLTQKGFVECGLEDV